MYNSFGLAGLEFTADKSRSVVIVKGRSMNITPFSVSKTSVHPEVSSPIPSIHSRPIKFLGRIIDGSISDWNFSAELPDELLEGLSVIDKSRFSGTQKLWILPHLLIPRIQSMKYQFLSHLNWNRKPPSSFVSGYIFIIQHQVFTLQYHHVHCHSKAYHQH